MVSFMQKFFYQMELTQTEKAQVVRIVLLQKKL